MKPSDRKTAVKINRTGVSLHSLLDSTMNYSLARPRKEDCLNLAVIISSSLLQLYSTPWLPPNWCTRSIYFTGPVSDLHSVNIKCPYVTSVFDGSNPPSETRPILGLHPDLIALGIILLELSEKKLIKQWWVEQKLDTDFPDDLQGKAQAAWRWFDDVSEKMNAHYRRAFMCCLNAHALDIVPRSEMTLANQRFREAFFHHIVLHLEDAYIEYAKEVTQWTFESYDCIR